MNSMPRIGGIALRMRKYNLWCVSDHKEERLKQVLFISPAQLNSTYCTRDNVTILLKYDCCPMEWMHEYKWNDWHEAYGCWNNSIDHYEIEIHKLPKCYWEPTPEEINMSKAFLDAPVPDFIKKLAKRN